MRRRVKPVEPGTVLPAELAAGPEIGAWGEGLSGLDGAVRAFKRWGAALREWASRVDMPWPEARGLARATHPWDREFLHANGVGELADYFDGLRAELPSLRRGWVAKF